MNAIQFTLLIKDKIITSIYTGDEHGCRCGCHGRYFKSGVKGFTRALNKAKPASAKGVYMQTCTVSATMTPGIRVDIRSADKEAKE